MSTGIMGLCCPLCGDASPGAVESIEKLEALVTGAGVCDPCAERVANAYWRCHGDRWLTWPNEARPAARKAAIPAELRTAVFERDAYRCRHCKTHIALTVDHVVPESKGGATILGNLQTLCRPCNSRKGARA